MTASVLNNFLADAEFVREHALAAPYIDWTAQDGETYRRVWLGEVPGLRAAIERAIGPVEMHGMGYRLNFNGEMPNAAIHSDLGWGTHALVLYLNPDEQCDGGTAFWRHRVTGAARIDVSQVELFEKVRHDWNDRSAWLMRSMVPMAFNRAIIYEGAQFHSRYPFAAFGDSPANGRLVAVAFFTPRKTP